jgi:uncharacterized protein
MKCPTCEMEINDTSPQCAGCGFHISQFDSVLHTPTERTGPAMDWAGVLSEEARQRLTDRLATFHQTTGLDLCVVTLPSAAPRSPREFVFWLFQRWQIGGEKHTGAQILLALAERRVEVEIGGALEHYITDDEAAEILQNHAIPFFARGDFDNGLFHCVDMLARVLEHGVREEARS